MTPTDTKFPFTPTKFDVMSVGPSGTAPRTVWFDTETEAVEHAQAQIETRFFQQVSITAHSESSTKSFAVLHLTVDVRTPDGEVWNSGWRCWFEGEFVGAVA